MNPLKQHLPHGNDRRALRYAPVGQREARGGNVANDRVEATGPTVDDAIDAALEELDLDEDEVDVEVLEEAGEDQPARVRVTPRAVATEEEAPPEEPGPWDDELATAGREILEDLLDFMGF